MTRTRKTRASRLWAEMTAIVLVASAVGLAWNRRLLVDAWTGTVTSPVPAVRGPATLIPLPLGLMQVKEIVDRKEGVVVDARDAAAYAAGHIPGAVSLPVGEAEARMDSFRAQVPVGTLLVAYCNGYSCSDSHHLAESLIQAGYRTVYVFAGGFPEWRDAGYPVARGPR